MSETIRDIVLNVRTKRDEGPTRSTERVDELGDHATKTTVRLHAMAKAGDKVSKSMLRMAGATAVAGKSLKNVDDGGKKLERMMFKIHKTIAAFGGMMQKMLVGGLKMATMSIGAMSVALVGVHALFIAGRFLIKSYHVALKGLAAGAAGATVAIGLVAAAMREQQAAQFAYAGRGHKEFGSGLRQAQVDMRSLHSDTVLAGAGAEALNKAYSTLAKSTTGFTGQSKGLLKGLTDFASAGQPLEEGLQKAAELVAVLQDKKKGFGAISEAAKAMGPEMKKAMDEAKKKGIDTRDELIKAIQDGTLAQLGGVTGQMDAVNNTLIGQLKKYFNLLRVQFADFGQQFLPEAKVGLERIFRIISDTLRASSGIIAGWEKRGGFVDTLVGAVQKVSDFYLKLISEWLPKSEGMFKRLGDWWRRFKDGWNEIADGLRPLIDGAKVIESSFGKAWKPIWNEIKQRSQEFNKTVQRNAPAFEQFGKEVGNSVSALLKLLNLFERIIVNNLPTISRIVRSISVLVDQFLSLFNTLSNLPFFSDRSAFLALMGMARGMKTIRGTLVERNVNTQNMNVKANSVSLMGTIKGAYDGYKLGKLGGPKGAAIGAVAGGLAGGGWLGGTVKEKWDATAGKAARFASLKGIFGGGKAAAAALAPSAASAGTAASSLLKSAGSTATAVKSLGTSVSSATTATDKSARGLGHFSKALGKATGKLIGLRSGGGGGPPPVGPIYGPPSPPPPPAGPIYGPPAPVHAPPRGLMARITGKGSPVGAPSNFSRLFRGMARIGGNGRNLQNQANADAQQGHKPFGGMGGFMYSLALMNMAERVDNEQMAAMLSLGGSAAMFSPKMGLGIAAGGVGLTSEDAGFAALGGGFAGGLFGSNFGRATLADDATRMMKFKSVMSASGTLIGIGIGTITGAVMAQVNTMKNASKRASAEVKNFFTLTTGEIMVQLAQLEGSAQRSGKKQTTITDSMDKAAQRMAKISRIAGRGAKGGVEKTYNLGYMDTVMPMTGAGAAAGALVGTPFAGIGALAGAGVGGALGFAGGNIAYLGNKAMQFFKGKNDRRAERGLAINQLYAEGIISQGQFNKLNEGKKNKFLGIDRLKKDQVVDDAYQQKFLEEMQSKGDAYEQAYRNTSDIVEARIKLIQDMTGKTEVEVVQMAQQFGVNLADNMNDFNISLETMGLTIVKTAQEIDAAIATMNATSFRNAFETAIKQQNAPHILNDIVKNFYSDFKGRGKGAKVTTEDASTIFQGYLEQLTNMYGGDATKAYFELRRQIGSEQGLAFQEINPLTGKRNPLGGLGGQFLTGQVGQATTKALGDAEKNMISTLKPQLGAVLAQNDLKLADPAMMAQVEQQFGKLSIQDQERFTNILSAGDYKTAGFTSAEQFLQSFGMNVKVDQISAQQKAFTLAKDNIDKESELLIAEMKVVEDMGKFFGEGADRPEWWSSEALRQLFIDAGLIEQDTRTPRGRGIGDTTSSRLSRTLARHEAMNSMISGKRMVTSSFRTNNLGSINSDHLTGRAYDLVGNQLGMYKTVVERNGGFAEFHGGSTNRHLHVVPGPGPMGDTTVPSYSQIQTDTNSGSGPMSAKSSNVTINLNVNGIGVKEAVPMIKAELERAMYEYENRG